MASASESPSVSPSESPSESPSMSPSGSPSESSSASPSVSPSGSPSVSPSMSSSKSPSVSPSASPSIEGFEVVMSSLIDTGGVRGVQVMKWEGLGIGGSNVGAGYSCPHYADKSIQVIGTFGGATVTVEGSNMIDNPTYAALKDAPGDALTFTSAGIKQILENTYWVRPVISGEGATTDLDVYLLVETMR